MAYDCLGAAGEEEGLPDAVVKAGWRGFKQVAAPARRSVENNRWKGTPGE